MKINTDLIEHILRTKYGWDRFPLDEQPENKDEEKKSENCTCIGRQKN